MIPISTTSTISEMDEIYLEKSICTKNNKIFKLEENMFPHLDRIFINMKE